MDWKEYEEEIFKHFRSEFPSARITRDARVLGRYSKVERQIDILIEDDVAGFEIRIAIDAKHHNRPLDVTDVEAFLGYCSDIGASKGVMISLHGYSPAALKRAHNDDSDVELDVLNFDELKQFQAFGAIPYAGGYGVLLPAPFGWVVDITVREWAWATLFQRGYDLDQAQRANEWMYIYFWDKSKHKIVSTLEGVITGEGLTMRERHPDAEFTYQDGPARKNGVTKIRRVVTRDWPTPEYTGFVEFDEFIFCCVMFSPFEVEKRNLRKLKYILKTVEPVKINYDEKSLLETLKSRPSDQQSFMQLIFQLRRERRFDEYKKVVMDYIALDYGNTYMFSTYVDFLHSEGIFDIDHEIARELTEREFSSNKEIGAVFYNLGWIAKIQGDKQLALQYFKKSFDALKQLENPPPASIDALARLVASLQSEETEEKNT